MLSALTSLIDSIIVKQTLYRSGKLMDVVKISPKFQIVIPKKVRAALRLKPGQKIQVIPLDNRIELIPERKIAEMRGFLRGMDSGFDREEDRT